MSRSERIGWVDFRSVAVIAFGFQNRMGERFGGFRFARLMKGEPALNAHVGWFCIHALSLSSFPPESRRFRPGASIRR